MELKRDFNLGAHIFLGLSIFAVSIEIINSILEIRTDSMFGYGVDYPNFFKQLVINVAIIISAIFTYRKSSIALKLLVFLFIIRTIICVPSTGSLYSYYLGSNFATLLRDFGPFAIAMCFKKNGISGWKSMLASDESLSAMSTKEETSFESLATEATKDNVNEDLKESNTIIVEKNDEQVGVVKPEPELGKQANDEIKEKGNDIEIEKEKNNEILKKSKSGLGLNIITAYILIGIIDVICYFLFMFFLSYNNIGISVLPMILIFTFLSWLSKTLFSYFTSPKPEVKEEDSLDIFEQPIDNSISNKSVETIVNTNDIDRKDSEPIPNENLPVENQPTIQVIKIESTSPKKQSIKQRWLLISVSVFLGLLALFFAIIAIKPYPEYINSFSDKIKYTFNLPNNELANLYYEKAEAHHHFGSFVVKRGDKTEEFDFTEIYKNHDLYSRGCELYAKDFDRIEDILNIIDTCKYYISYFYKGDFNYGIVTGDRIIANTDFIKENDVIIHRINRYNLEYEYKEGKKLMDIIQYIPVTDNNLIEEVYSYYENIENYTMLLDFFDHKYKFNKHNNSFLNLYAKAFLLSNDVTNAKEIANQVLKTNPKDTEALSSLAEAYCIEGDWDKAKDYSQKAIDFGTDNNDAYFINAEALYKLGNKKEARRIYNLGNARKGYSKLEEKYKEAGGSPFTINSIDFSFKKKNGDLITQYGETLYSRKSQFLCPRINITADRTVFSIFEEDHITLQCKIYSNGELQLLDNSNDYTYEYIVRSFLSVGETQYIEIGGWGNSYSGCWASGHYRFEVYYNDDLIGEESFYIY